MWDYIYKINSRIYLYYHLISINDEDKNTVDLGILEIT